MDLQEIADQVRSCKKCDLWKTRKNAVPGEGNPQAEIMFIGEAPGENEDLEGRPFVGAAGKLLTKLITEVLGLKREEVYITNVVKCRPPENRDPTDSEILSCSPYLKAQIDLIKPKIIVTLGRHSTSYVFSLMGRTFTSITKVRGKEFNWKKDENTVIRVFPTYHPAAALYNPNLRKVLEDDFKKIREVLNPASSSKTVTLEYFMGGENRPRDKGEEGDRDSIK
ncbi:type-4 uracil-DNA glycosylase [Stygiolobus caldivivus]|uniref:Type-4 uracil-DNA glycosylase n=1 Tax=Stygiolobus caldivivus TaxID=2824673 RepID=A0A8D5ZJK6_9CREN|nr:type-4 uracil-DNA glycosylase [Stygiolobus caldivivus]BCU70277.1 uracil-DNA glycosylase [Stygiolobus caldivivus]